MSDPQIGQGFAEATDDEKLGEEYPPEQPLGAEEYGTTAAEQRIGEPLDERVEREETEADERDRRGSARPLPADDVATGDTTTRDVATEREAPRSAEEDAVRVHRSG